MRQAVIFLAILLVCSCPLLNAQEKEVFDLKEAFLDADLEAFISFVATSLNKRILYESSVKGRKIFLIAPSPIPKEKLFQVFLSVMEYNNFIVERTGTRDDELVIKIKRNIQGPWTPTWTIQTKEELAAVENSDDFISMVIKLKYISAREVQTTLRALRIVNPQGGNLAGIEGSNTILVTDYAPNVRRIYDVIQLMDQPGPEKLFRTFRLRYANAADVVEYLNEFSDKRQRTAGVGIGPDLDEVKIVADPRLNAIIVQAYPSRLESMEALINELDQQLEIEPGVIHYIRLKHIDAKQTQEVLAKLLESGGLVGGPPGTGGVPTPGKRVASGIDIPEPPAVEADLQNNALIVKAEEREWQEIRQIIEQMDVRRPQVLIEAAILEISPSDLLGLGVEIFLAGTPDDDEFEFAGGTNFGFSNLALVNGGTATPINGDDNNFVGDKFGKIPAVRQGFERNGFFLGQYDDVFTLPFIVNAIKTRADTKVLSMPRVVTNDNSPAELKVANAQPSETNEEDNNGDNVRSFDGFQEAGTVLQITPHISGEQNYLRLDISQVIEEFDLASAQVGGINAKTVRSVNTSVTIPDGQTVAIGGLSSNIHSVAVEKVPLLGDLPLIGFLFQTRIVSHREQNIYLFVTPHILRDETFKDFVKISHDAKIDAQKYGVDVGQFDKSFAKYQKKYELDQDDLNPLYMLEYQSPGTQK